MYTIKGRYTNALITNDETEEQCITQVSNMINNIAFDKPVVLQADAHMGKGSAVGFTMPLSKYIVPNAIGVDIGCGCVSVCCGNKLNIKLKDLDSIIREWIPTGMNININKKRYGSLPNFSFEDQFPWNRANDILNKFVIKFNEKFDTDYDVSAFNYNYFIEKCKAINVKVDRAEASILSLGGGNHFISISKSAKYNNYWIDVHTGSRNFGKCICEFHQKIAQENISNKRNNVLKKQVENISKSTEDKSQISKLIKEAKKDLGLDFDVNIKGMEYLQEKEAFNYLVDMIFAQQYAKFNRDEIIKTILEIIGSQEEDRVESIHNYIDFKDFVIRKGAIRSYIGERMIMPLNMRDGILLCEGKSNSEWNFSAPHGAGKSNSEWNFSAPHGAGRVLSRSKAKEQLSLEEFKEQMKDIYSTSVVASVLDEAPGAYKDASMIENAIEPTATVLDKLIPILNIKDKSTGMTWKERKIAKKKSKERIDKIK